LHQGLKGRSVVSKPVARSKVIQPTVELDDVTWYWISQPRGARTWPADPGQRVRIRYVHGDQFCEVVEEAAGVMPDKGTGLLKSRKTKSPVPLSGFLVGRHVILNGRKEKIIDAGAARTDDKGYRLIRVELAGGKVCDLLAPVETLD